MPCNSEYMEQNDKERRLQETAKLYKYALEKLGKHVPNGVSKAANDYYCEDDYVPDLCNTIKKMTQQELDKIVYNAHNKTSRKLADWWEEHLAADHKRLAEEQAEQQREQLRKDALKKLTPEEIEALGLDE